MRFVVLGDLHYATYADPALAAARDRTFGAFFSQVAAAHADFVFAIGDATNRGTVEELAGQDAVAAQSGVKLIRITGNHDTDSQEKSEMANFFLGGSPSVSPTELYTSFDSGPTRFVLLDTSRVKMSGTNWSGFVSDEQLEWFASEVERFNAASTSAYFVVLGHHPIFGTTQRSTEKWLNIENSEALHALFGKLRRGTRFYICGHNHTNSIFGPDAMGWYYVQAGAPLICQGYRLITIDEGGVKVETIDFDLSDPELYADFDAARHKVDEFFSVPPLEKVYGTLADRSLLVGAALV